MSLTGKFLQTAPLTGFSVLNFIRVAGGTGLCVRNEIKIWKPDNLSLLPLSCLVQLVSNTISLQTDMHYTLM